MAFKGIDVSVYQNITDYAAVKKDGVDFVIMKLITKNLNHDNRFKIHWKGFTDVGIPIQGVYDYIYAGENLVSDFITRANAVIRLLEGKKTFVWLDIEDACLKDKGQTLVKAIVAYRKVLADAGLNSGVYSGQYFYNTYIKPWDNQLGDCPLWIAKYPSSKQMKVSEDPNMANAPKVGKDIYGWQYSSKGSVAGIIGNVDMDIWFADIEAKELESAHQDTAASDNYKTDGFRKEMAVLLGLPETATASQILNRTVTISTSKNRNHKTVTALERLMKEYGYYTGAIEADQGKTPIFGAGMARATALYQAKQVGLSKPDQEWTCKKNSYRKALGLK